MFSCTHNCEHSILQWRLSQFRKVVSAKLLRSFLNFCQKQIMLFQMMNFKIYFGSNCIILSNFKKFLRLLLIHMYSVFKTVTTSCSWPYLIKTVCSKIKLRDYAFLPLKKCFFQISCTVRKGKLPILSCSFLR